MSVRAYKLIEIKTEERPTFNCWQDDRIMRIAEGEGDVIQISKERAEEELEKVDEELLKERDIDTVRELESDKITLKNIITDCGDEDYVEYYCY